MNEAHARTPAKNGSVKNSLHASESISAVDIVALSGSAPNSQSLELKELSSETKPLVIGPDSPDAASSGISATGFKVLLLLAVQNCSKNLLLRFVMKEHPKFLTSAAILGVEGVKLTLSLLYIVLIQRRPIMSAVTFMQQDKKNTYLMAVPATLYSIQMTLEYVALGNIDAAVFSVLVQTKLLATAGCAVLILGKRIKKVQLISLILLTVGVMLCNMKNVGNAESEKEDTVVGDSKKGIMATLGIAACSGFASVYTEKVIKAKRSINSGSNAQLPSQQQQVKDQPVKENYGLAYTQVQLAVVSLIIMGFYCMVMELDEIMEKGLWYGFTGPAFISIFVSAIGGLIVAAVLKFADAVLKGYATAISVVLTGVLSMVLFGTHLNTLYFLGIGNVVCAVFLYSAKDLDRLLC
eukprot:CAMPEP_0172301992 /NCGR_PEP_ID=MMETSP1058-20130122/3773_1 /TAXON_ID=83371 /ORGANISM="Detonula confervacea, Strain CCMP 353" /LENGTH=408 /DNA_ID=CAMNT_0013012315 /DNA_START=85 /DNA_END=1311 /DNA_ORIENTATION=-